MNIKKLVLISLFTAIAFVLANIKFPLIPLVGFLTYEPKDVILIIAGFVISPLAGVLISIFVAAIEMMTISSSGIIGFFMNAVASIAFVFPASVIYHKKRTLNYAIIGLAIGTISMTAIMTLWNYILTPIFLGFPREAVVEILLPGIVPFNLLKGFINSFAIVVVYKPMMSALKKVHMHEDKEVRKNNVLFAGILIFVLLSLVIYFYVANFS